MASFRRALVFVSGRPHDAVEPSAHTERVHTVHTRSFEAVVWSVGVSGRCSTEHEERQPTVDQISPSRLCAVSTKLPACSSL